MATIAAPLGADIDEAGLSSAEARRRLATDGPNAIRDPSRRGVWRILAAQVTDTTVLVLAGAALVAALVGERADATAIVAILLLNAVLGFTQDFRAEQAMRALGRLAAPTARVMRDGAWVVLPSVDVVSGDLVALEAGNTVPADLRIVSAHRLTVDESLLTGESLPCEKVAAVDVTPTTREDRGTAAFKGTHVTSGRGTGIVVATGMRTELGRIATLVADNPEGRTPLQRRLARFGRVSVEIIVVLCVVMFGIGVLRGEPADLMLMTALSLAVAAIPESLPAVVTVSLALSARRMVRRHALIRRLPAVETLGSVTWICADKTGTLTENRMRVETVVAGAALDPVTPADATAVSPWHVLYEAMAVVNDAAPAGGDWTGDPTEVALVRAASAAGALDARDRPRLGEAPFSSRRGRMTTIHDVDGGLVAYTKGAPERVVDGCVDALAPDGVVPLDRDRILARALQLAGQGLRVIALAMRRLDALPANAEEAESEQTFIGLVGLLDPPRAGARDAVSLCRSAGITVVMITGDHPGTARAIAARIGIAGQDDDLITGADLGAMSDEELDARVARASVYARVAPEDKLRIVAALQRAGELVAMTGDGVNDAPALRRADIGVAMGRNGTDVAREAADMVLLDDDFATIVGAVSEGRRVHDNVRRFIRYGLSTNSGEILTLFVAPLLGLPLPLLPIQILWMNLVTDGLPGLALAAEPPEHDVMERPPVSPDEGSLMRGLWAHAAWVGLLMTALALGMQRWALGTGRANWQTMTFTVLTLSQLAHVLAIRSERRSLLALGLLSNGPLLAAVGSTLALQLAVIYLPAANRFAHTTPLSVGELLLCAGASLLVLVAVEADKWRARRPRRE